MNYKQIVAQINAYLIKTYGTALEDGKVRRAVKAIRRLGAEIDQQKIKEPDVAKPLLTAANSLHFEFEAGGSFILMPYTQGVYMKIIMPDQGYTIAFLAKKQATQIRDYLTAYLNTIELQKDK